MQRIPFRSSGRSVAPYFRCSLDIERVTIEGDTPGAILGLYSSDDLFDVITLDTEGNGVAEFTHPLHIEGTQSATIDSAPGAKVAWFGRQVVPS